jgi:hypothetical protein
MPTAPAASSAVGAGAELCAPLAKLFEATGGAAPLFYSNLVPVLALSLLLGNHDERRKDAIKAFTVNEGFEEVFGTMGFMHICKTTRTCKEIGRDHVTLDIRSAAYHLLQRHPQQTLQRALYQVARRFCVPSSRSI